MATEISGLIKKLEAVYGPASAAGFGSAVFQGNDLKDPEETAKSVFRSFLGDKWKEGGQPWMANWKIIFSQQGPAPGGIMAALKSLPDQASKNVVPLLAEMLPDPSAAEKTLAEVFDQSSPESVHAFYLGDGDAMSGILLLEHWDKDFVTVVALMD